MGVEGGRERQEEGPSPPLRAPEGMTKKNTTCYWEGRGIGIPRENAKKKKRVDTPEKKRQRKQGLLMKDRGRGRGWRPLKKTMIGRPRRKKILQKSYGGGRKKERGKGKRGLVNHCIVSGNFPLFSTSTCNADEVQGGTRRNKQRPLTTSNDCTKRHCRLKRVKGKRKRRESQSDLPPTDSSYGSEEAEDGGATFNLILTRGGVGPRRFGKHVKRKNRGQKKKVPWSTGRFASRVSHGQSTHHQGKNVGKTIGRDSSSRRTRLSQWGAKKQGRKSIHRNETRWDPYKRDECVTQR